MSARDITGQRFTRLVALRRAGTSGGNAMWLFICDCGKEVTTTGCNVRSGHTRSCGCYNREQSSERAKRSTGRIPMMGWAMRGRPEYISYCSAKTRCNDSTSHNYRYYGGRGIKFLFADFREFFAELGPKPTPKHTVDRINNDGHYQPGNVRWATMKEQAANTRRRGTCQ